MTPFSSLTLPNGRPLRFGALLATALLATACGTASDELSNDSSDRPAQPTPSASAEPVKEPYTVAIGGDVMFEGMLRQRLDADPATAMGPVAEVFQEADVSVVNLETAVTDGGTPAPAKQFVFRAPATAFTALKEAGIDVATVANNHGMDYGTEGLLDTLENAEAADFPIIGAGRDIAEAYEPEFFEVKGNTLAIIGATDVLDDHLIPEWTAGEGKPGLASTKGEMITHAIDAVEKASAEADAVIVFLHWGLEGDHCPLPHAPTSPSSSSTPAPPLSSADTPTWSAPAGTWAAPTCTTVSATSSSTTSTAPPLRPVSSASPSRAGKSSKTNGCPAASKAASRSCSKTSKQSPKEWPGSRATENSAAGST